GLPGKFHAFSNKYGECALTLQSGKLPEKKRGIPSSRGRLTNARPTPWSCVRMSHPEFGQLAGVCDFGNGLSLSPFFRNPILKTSGTCEERATTFYLSGRLGCSR